MLCQVTVCAATDLQSTQFMTRHNLDKDSSKTTELDPYVAIDVDELYVERTSTKRKTNDPDWNETFSTDLLRSAEEVRSTHNLYHRFKLFKLYKVTRGKVVGG